MSEFVRVRVWWWLQVIRVNSQLRRPSGILWHRLSPQKLGQIRVLRELKQRIEQETGQELPTGMYMICRLPRGTCLAGVGFL